MNTARRSERGQRQDPPKRPPSKKPRAKGESPSRSFRISEPNLRKIQFYCAATGLRVEHILMEYIREHPIPRSSIPDGVLEEE